MNTKNLLAIAFALVTGVSMSAAYADYDHRDDRDYRNDHRDSREYRRERERREDYARHEYRGPRNYVAARPVYVSPPVVYAQPVQPSLNIVVPITLP
jgi:hypothetical protein